MNIPSAIALSAFGVWLAAVPVAAQTYVVGVENIEYYPQYTYRDGEYGGFGRAVLDAFAASRGYTLEYRALPVSRLFASFIGGDLDLKYPDNPYWSAAMKKGYAVVYSDPVVAYVDGVSLRPEQAGKGPDAIRTLGIVRGFTAWDWQDRIAAGTVEVQENNSFTALLEQALVGRVDGAYGNVAVVNHLLGSVVKRPGTLVFDPGLPHTSSHYHLSSIRHPQLVAEFNEWMKRNEATVTALKAEYKVETGVR